MGEEKKRSIFGGAPQLCGNSSITEKRIEKISETREDIIIGTRCIQNDTNGSVLFETGYEEGDYAVRQSRNFRPESRADDVSVTMYEKGRRVELIDRYMLANGIIQVTIMKFDEKGVCREKHERRMFEVLEGEERSIFVDSKNDKDGRSMERRVRTVYPNRESVSCVCYGRDGIGRITERAIRLILIKEDTVSTEYSIGKTTYADEHDINGKTDVIQATEEEYRNKVEEIRQANADRDNRDVSGKH